MANTSAAVTLIQTHSTSSYLQDSWLFNVTGYNDINTTIDNNSDNLTEISTQKQLFLPCNNPENLVDEATAEQVERLLHLTALPLLELFGVVTNVINCLVFARQGLKDRINLCLFSLALADISFLLLIFAAKFFSVLGLFDEDLEEYWSQKYLNTVLGPMLGMMNISNLMTMIISLERCICVVSPFTAKKFLKTKYMAIGISIMAVYVLGFYSLLNMKYVTTRLTDPQTNASRWLSRLSDFYLDQRTVIDILYNHLLSLTIPCVSLAVVVVATSITVNTLRTSLAWRHEMASMPTAGERREAGVTKMLSVVCFVYVTTITPSIAQAFVRTLVPGYLPSGKYCNTFVVTQTLAHVCEVTNSSVNFLVYFSMGTRFRATVKDIFRRNGSPDKSILPIAVSLPTISQEL